jgi:nucleolin
MSPQRVISVALALASASAFSFHAPSRAAVARSTNSRLFAVEGDADYDILNDGDFSPLPFMDEPVEVAKEPKLYVGNLNYGIEDEDLERIFSEFGSVVSANHIISREDPTRKRGFGFVTFASLESAEAAAAALDGQNIEGRSLKVDFASNKPSPRRDFSESRQSRPPQDDGCRVYVGNLDYQTSDDTLNEMFSEFGEVKSCNHMTDQDDPSRKRGFGFVTFSSADEANQAVENLDGLEVDGRSIRVNIAQPRPSRW